jgi:hypothetical protein
MIESTYHNSMVSREIASWGVVDRFVRSGAVTLEHVVSIHPVVGPLGHPMMAILLDLLDGEKTLCTIKPIGFYALASLSAALNDGDRVGRTVGIRCRLSSPDLGWRWIYDPDDGMIVKPTLIIPTR